MKKAKDLFIEDGEYKAPALRGAFEKWVAKDWSISDDVDSHIRYREDQRKVAVCYKDFESWLNRMVEEDWFKEIKPEYGSDEPKQIFEEYWENNPDLRESVEEHTKLVTVAGNPGTNNESSGDGSDGDDVQGQDSEGQSSFGASQFPELFEIGVVNDSGQIKPAKMRGLAKAFVKDVNEILGESDSFEPKWAQRAMLYWGKDRFGDGWLQLAVNDVGNGEIYDAVKFIYTSDTECADLMHEKYNGGKRLGLGNPDTDDLLKDFISGEGIELEKESGKEEEGKKGKWEQFEEESGTDEPVEEEDAGEDAERNSKSKWEQFEEESGKQSNNGSDDSHESSSTRSGETDSASTSDSDSSNSGPETLGGWAEREGKTDSASPSGKASRSNSGGKGGKKKETIGQGSKSTTDTSGSTDVECEDGGRPHKIKWPDVEPIDEFDRNRIYEGNTFEWALKLPENSVDTIVTSPPYYNLRDYDIEDAYPISGDWTCDHEFDGEFCIKCGCFLGQLGAEPDPATFIDHIVDLMERYKRVLKPTGSLWLNIGDTYAGKNMDGRVKAKKKSRIMVPERIYRRMVQTGWHMRDYVIWVKKIWTPDDGLKGNGKPFASSSRLADQWEPMVRFTKEESSYTDVDSNRLMPPSFSGDMGKEGSTGKFRDSKAQGGDVSASEDTQRGRAYHPMGTNPPDVWHINSDGYQGDHRAVFPEELPKRCIQFTTPDRVCANCGVPYEKEVHVEDENTVSPGGDYSTYDKQCSCDADHKPGVAFDPFLGSGTTAVAAANSGFDWAGVELSEKYQKLARDRIPQGRQVGLDQW